MNAPTSQPDNERIFNILSDADANFRKMLTEMIEAKATPDTLRAVINSWEMLRASVSNEQTPYVFNRFTGRAVAGAAVGAAMIPRGDGAWVPQSYTPEEVEAVEKYLQQIRDNDNIVFRSSADDS